MTNEIKEIIELLKEDLYIPQEDNREYKLLDKGDDKLLLDYITNLQEENKQLRENNLSMQEEMSLRWNELDNLQKRIDKAVEYIEKNQIQNEYTDRGGFRVKENKYWLEDSDILLDILRGDE